MDDHYRGERPTRTKLRAKAPKALDLITGFPDDPRLEQLGPDHDHFKLFAWAWQMQDTWTLDVHAEFWQAALPLWPLTRGRREVVETQAYALCAARRQGLSDEQAAERFGYQLDSLRRRGVPALADGLPKIGEGVVTDYVLPRIHDADSDAEPPSPHAYPNITEDPSSTKTQAAVVEQLDAALLRTV